MTKIGELGPKLELYTLPFLINYLTNKEIKSANEINIIEFGLQRIEQLIAEKGGASGANMLTLVNSLVVQKAMNRNCTKFI